ncbi:hypothetical protein NKR19_g8271 [Coniochaeta hoffmannii]|uniref:DUF1531-domain-containing protein n=1 Tax=Coniochaeta hoffmannii TaxID=91930 RepID=A0AA38R4X8_9PEZI|nr:hypothetical protein NKR19_g8271 [Coniochaeta hoffmannii]
MDFLRDTAALLGERLANNVKSGFSNMTPEKWIRIIIVAGAYALLRPYIIKLGAKQQMKAHERQEAEDAAAAEAAITPNQLRGQIDIPDDSDDEEDALLGAGKKKEEVTAAVTATEWGKKARRRQRDVIKKLLDAEEERLRQLQEDEEDKDIEEFMVKE